MANSGGSVSGSPAGEHSWGEAGRETSQRIGGSAGRSRYAFVVSSPGAGARSVPSTSQTVATLRDELDRFVGFDLVVLFGSFARGEQHAGSDVDLLMDGPATADVEALARVRGRLIERLGRPIEVLALRDAVGSPEVMVGALRDGLVLTDREEQWPALLDDYERFDTEARAVYEGYPARRAAAVARLTVPAPAR